MIAPPTRHPERDPRLLRRRQPRPRRRRSPPTDAPRRPRADRARRRARAAATGRRAAAAASARIDARTRRARAAAAGRSSRCGARGRTPATVPADAGAGAEPRRRAPRPSRSPQPVAAAVRGVEAPPASPTPSRSPRRGHAPRREARGRGPAPPSDIPKPRGGRAPRMVALTLLDGTTITLPAQATEEATPRYAPRRGRRPRPRAPGEDDAGLTARDLVAALRAMSHGADATEILGQQRALGGDVRRAALGAPEEAPHRRLGVRRGAQEDSTRPQRLEAGSRVGALGAAESPEAARRAGSVARAGLPRSRARLPSAPGSALDLRLGEARLAQDRARVLALRAAAGRVRGRSAASPACASAGWGRTRRGSRRRSPRAARCASARSSSGVEHGLEAAVALARERDPLVARLLREDLRASFALQRGLVRAGHERRSCRRRGRRPRRTPSRTSARARRASIALAVLRSRRSWYGAMPPVSGSPPRATGGCRRAGAPKAGAANAEHAVGHRDVDDAALCRCARARSSAARMAITHHMPPLTSASWKPGTCGGASAGPCTPRTPARAR